MRTWFSLISFICDLRSSIYAFLSKTFLSISSTYFFFIAKSDFYWRTLIETSRWVLFSWWFHLEISSFFWSSSYFSSFLNFVSFSSYLSSNSFSSSFKTSMSKLIISISDRYWVSVSRMVSTYFCPFFIVYYKSAIFLSRSLLRFEYSSILCSFLLISCWWSLVSSFAFWIFSVKSSI